MSAPGLVLSKIGPESDVLLRNLFQHYCHDMSEWFDLDTGADGSYPHDTSSIWAKQHGAYLARIGTSIAGFALIGSGADWLGDMDAWDVHEFFVLRKFRRCGVGRRMAALLWNEHPGEWLVRVFEANAPAVSRASIPSIAFSAILTNRNTGSRTQPRCSTARPAPSMIDAAPAAIVT